MSDRRPSILRSLYVQVVIAVALGILVGWLWPTTGAALKPLGDGFIKLVKMIITPVIFLTVVTGIAGMRDLGAFGRIAAKALGYFIAVSTLALAVGLVVANVVQPGAGLNVDPATLDTSKVASYVSQAKETSVTGFLLNIIPDTMFSAFTSGEILQVLLVSILFGIALAMLGDRGERLLEALRTITAVVFRVVRILMYAAPVGAFGAMAFTIGQYGIGTLAQLAELVVTFYATAIAVCAGRARHHCRPGRILDPGAAPIYQGRAPAGARHLILGKRNAAADGEAGGGGLPEEHRRPRRPRWLFVQPRRHQHLHVARCAVHRTGDQHAPDDRPAAAADGGRGAELQGGGGSHRLRISSSLPRRSPWCRQSRSRAWR